MAFFYIVKHVISGRYYAGMSKGKPDTFMTTGGYCTSGSLVKLLIDRDGLDSFVVSRVRMFEDDYGAFSYETRFLKKVNASKNSAFLNLHNNEFNGFGSPEFYRKTREIVEMRYGVSHVLQSDIVKMKSVETSIKKYGVTHPMKDRRVLEKQIATNMERRGVMHPMQDSSVKEKTISTNLSSLGVEWPMQSEEVREKAKTNNIEKYGYASTSQIPEHRLKISNLMKEKARRQEAGTIREMLKELRIKCPRNLHLKSDEYLFKCMSDFVNFANDCARIVGKYPEPKSKEETDRKRKSTNLERYGFDSWTKTDAARDMMKNVGIATSCGASLEKRKKTNLERYGNEYSIRSDVVRDKMKTSTLKNHGVEYYMQSSEFKKKRKKNSVEKYGVPHYRQTLEWKNKISSVGIERSSRPNLKLLKDMLKEQGKKIPSGLHMKSDDFINGLIGEMTNGGKSV